MKDLFNYKNLPQFPDRYTRDKGWIRVLPVAGRPIQSAEMIEMQSIISDNLRQGLNVLYSDGSIVNGLGIRLVGVSANQTILANGGTTQYNSYSVNSGSLYVQGYIINVTGTTIDVATTGTFNIGVSITPQVINELDDPNLRDPIKGGANYGTAGASRLIFNTAISIDDPDGYIIGTIVNGNVIQNTSSALSSLNDLLAQYTYERNGNFCVEGYNISITDSTTKIVADTTQYNSLQTQIANSQSDLGLAQTNLNNSNSRITSLNNQLVNALSNYTLTPSNANALVVSNLQTQINQEQALNTQYTSLVTSKTAVYNAAVSNAASIDSLLVDKVTFSISSGTAYVLGYRIHNPSPYALVVPKSLDTATVQQATFTYAATTARQLKTLILNSASTFSALISHPGNLTLTFTKLSYNTSYITVVVTINLQIMPSTVVDVPSLIDFLVGELSKSNGSSFDPSITFTSTSLSTPDTIRSALRNNVIVTRSGTSGILFNSTTASSNANQINIGIVVNSLDSGGNYVGPSTILTVDVPSSNLAGGGNQTSFQLGLRPVAQIISLVAQLEQPSLPLIRGAAPGTSDNIGSNSIFLITSVVQGSVTYQEGRDYNLINQSQIDWSPSASDSIEPLPGTTYYVSFVYTTALAEGKDFSLDQTTDSISFTGLTPAANRQFTVTYSYFLSKAGTITLDKNGIFNYILSDASVNPLPPVASSDVLTIATFLLSGTSTVTPADCRAITFTDIKSLASQVKNNTLNIQTLNLNTKGYNLAYNDIGAQPIGIYTDTLNDISKLNITNPNFTGSIVPSIGAVTGGFNHKDVALKYTSGGRLSRDTQGNPYFITLAYTTSILQTQARATQTRIINPIATSGRGVMTLSIRDSFLDAPLTLLNPCDILTNTTSYIARVSNNRPVFFQTISDLNQILFKSLSTDISNSIVNGRALSYFSDGDNNSYLDLMTRLPSSAPTSITLTCTGFSSLSDGFRLYVAGVEIRTYNLIGSTSLSPTLPGTIRADINGNVSLSFDLPSISCGNHLIELIGSIDYAKNSINIYNNLASHIALSAIYNWDNILTRVVADSITPLSIADYTDYSNITPSSISNSSSVPLTSNTQSFDPTTLPILLDNISQSFVLSDYYFITSIDLALSSISARNVPLNVSIKDASDLAPCKTLYNTGLSSSYSVSSNGSNWTNFLLSYPTLLNGKYCIGVSSSDPNYSLYTGVVGQLDIQTQSIVGDQLLLQGKLFISNDGNSIATYTNEDITYRIQRAVFNTNSSTIVNLGSYGIPDSVSHITAFCLNIREILPGSSNVLYEYSVDDTTWQSFNANIVICLSPSTPNLYMRATLSTGNDNVSPMLVLSGSSVSLYSSAGLVDINSSSYLSTSTIISNQAIYNSSYSRAVVNLEYLDTGYTTTSTDPYDKLGFKVYYSPNDGLPIDGQEWYLMTPDFTTLVVVDPGTSLTTLSFRYSNPTNLNSLGNPRTKFRYRIDISSSEPSNPPVIRNIISYVY